MESQWSLAILVLVSIFGVCFCDPHWTSGQRLEACDCNGKSTKCYFDRDLWEKTGHGGRCLDCEDNTTGPRCESCLDNFYRRKDGECVACSCDHVGSFGRECTPKGQCSCKQGFGGLRCDRCAPNHYRVSPHSCLSCGCDEAGVSNKDLESCSTPGGPCKCKDNVEGHLCERCKAGSFDLQVDKDFGCTPCFCYGHSRDCQTTPGYYKVDIESKFSQNTEEWMATDYYGREVTLMHDPDLQVLELRSPGRESIYFTCPSSYLGNQRASYNQLFSFTLRIGGEGARATVEDLILEGAGLRVSLPIVGQGNPLPNARNQNYSYLLNEHPDFDWTPRLSSQDFMRLLSNLTAIKIKGLYVPGGVGYIDNVQMGSASRTPSSGLRTKATWIETCRCPEGYMGASCEACAPSYVRDPPDAGPFAKCVKCNCHGHADVCNPQTGQCDCQHNTAGDRCDRCSHGFYGNPLQGTAHDCQPCPCPNRGPCVLLPGNKVACQQCPIGSTGHSCEQCVDGYYGDPLGKHGPPHPCTKCECSGNIDPNAVGNCNGTTGECLKCIYNTAGRHCQRCKTSFYGNSLAQRKGDCKECDCYLSGTIEREDSVPICDLLSGQCACQPFVTGRRCDQCLEGYWNIDSNRGCETCSCDPTGSIDNICDAGTGQCHCKPGVSGRRCDTCLTYHYGFSRQGCQTCNCDPAGSVSLQCSDTGQCPCRPNMEGIQCNQCKENKYNRGVVCIDCPPCYNLIEEAVDEHRDKLGDISKMLEEIRQHPLTTDDRDFRRRLTDVLDKVEDLLNDAQRAAGVELGIWDKFQDLRDKLREILNTMGKVADKTQEADHISILGINNITMAEEVAERAREAIDSAIDFFNSQAKDALEAARDRSAKLGEQSDRLSEIAREARTLADGHENDAKEISNIGDQAYAISSEAYALARDSVDSGERRGGEIYSLKKRADDLRDMMDRTQSLAQNAKKEAMITYDAALDIYTDGNSLVSPRVDADGLKEDASEIILEARRIRNEADGMEDIHKGELDKLNQITDDARKLLEAANKQQQITDELLADTDTALERAQEAVAAGDKTLDEARKTLGTLKEFDKSVQANKDQAKEALVRVPNIKRLIEEAETKTQDADEALGGAEKDALDARDIAFRAQRIAEQASKDADGIRHGSDQTKTQAAKLKTQSYQLSDNVEKTAEKLTEFEAVAFQEGELSSAALEVAHEGKATALDGLRKAQEVLLKLEEIDRTLSRLDNIDSRLLDELERRLTQAERELRNADLDTRVMLLKQARDQQRVWMKDYEDEIEQLKRDVENVNQIRLSLPEGCYRRVRLEP